MLADALEQSKRGGRFLLGEQVDLEIQVRAPSACRAMRFCLFSTAIVMKTASSDTVMVRKLNG